MTGTSAVREIYHRYHIETHDAPDIIRWPNRFNVDISKIGLITHILTSAFEYQFDREVFLARPCIYGVLSSPLGGLAPMPEKCVGCMRCAKSAPGFANIAPNPERVYLGDSAMRLPMIDAIAYEAETGRVPVKGAGYRGEFGGQGWDGIWTDMSEIVRPTRDGIHGREFISTVVTLGSRPSHLVFTAAGLPTGEIPGAFNLPLPMIFDLPPVKAAPEAMIRAMVSAAERLETLVVLPVSEIIAMGIRSAVVVPFVKRGEYTLLDELAITPRMIELAPDDLAIAPTLREAFPDTLLCLRMPLSLTLDLTGAIEAGISIFHLTANYHGTCADGSFIFEAIRAAHLSLVDARIRDRVTLIGSGGITAAEHVPKAIIGGLDAVALDTPLILAMQGYFRGEYPDSETGRAILPRKLTAEWATHRLTNLTAAWRDQLLEILGAMGLREVRRLRGEIGRALFQRHLEDEAFGEIEGYVRGGM